MGEAQVIFRCDLLPCDTVMAVGGYMALHLSKATR